MKEKIPNRPSNLPKYGGFQIQVIEEVVSVSHFITNML